MVYAISDPRRAKLEELKQKCMAELTEVIYSIGPWSVNKRHFARKYNTTWVNIDNWFTKIIQQCPREKIDNIKIMGESSVKKAMAYYEELMARPDVSPKIRLEAISKMNETLKNYTEFMEQWNMKPKVSDELNVSLSGSVDVDRILKIAQETQLNRVEAKIVPCAPVAPVDALEQ